MKFTYLKFAILLFCITNGFSQDLINSQTLINSNSHQIYEFDRSDKTIQGTPYIDEAFFPARITADVEKIFNARFNAVSGEIEVEVENNKINAINKLLQGIKVVFLKDQKTYKSITYFDEDGNTVTGFLVAINNSDSKVKLFLKETKVFIDRKPAKSSYQEAKPAKFDRLDDTYFLAIDNEIAKPLSKNKKDIAALFSNDEKKILKFIGSENLNVKKQEDLTKLIGYINQLKK